MRRALRDPKVPRAQPALRDRRDSPARPALRDRRDLRDLTNGWLLSGNSGTTAGTNFVGTTDTQPLELHVNGARVMRYEPAMENANSNASPNVIGGDSENIVGAGVQGATIAGGGGLLGTTPPAPNSVQADFGTVGGGNANLASGEYATVGGGDGDTASGEYASVGGGVNNTAGNRWDTVAGGLSNIAGGGDATVGGGGGNTAIGGDATVSGGYNNTASGASATVPGGGDNTAAGVLSFAAGSLAMVNGTDFGAFVWSDESGTIFASNGPNTFSARATGGVRFVTAIDQSTGATTQGCSIDTSGNLVCTGTVSSSSDRAMKADFEPIAAGDVLKHVAALPLRTWHFKGQTVRHIGPTAQDFHAAFKVGTDDKHISTTDAQGVALAAIQGLYQKLEAKDAQLAQQNKQIESLSARLEKLERETQASRNAAMHPVSALQPPRLSPVSRF